MDTLYTYKSTPDHLRSCVLAIGNFDGVHHGHKAVLEMVRTIAKNLNKPSGVMIFEPHPRIFFAPQKTFFRLTDLPFKLSLLQEQHIDVTVVLKFDENLAQLSAQDFVKEVLVEGLGINHVIVGYDFHFGAGRKGTPEILQELGQTYGFGVTIVEKQTDGEQVYSSTAIRDLLSAGNVSEAADLLGYFWRITGRVIDGAKRGTSLLGFPTANIELQKGQNIGHGIYAVRVYNDEKCYFGAAYMGTRPTFDDGKPILEVFLFDFDGDLYGQEIEVEFIDFIRGDAKFDNIEALKAQMHIDCEQAANILQNLTPHKSAV